MSSRQIANYETGANVPPTPVLEDIAAKLKVTPSYFFRPLHIWLSPDNVSFRSFSRLSAKARDSALANATTAIEIAEYFDAKLRLPPLDLPDLRGLDPAAAAYALRSEWGLGLDPLPNLIRLLELHGVRVFSLVHEFSALDAISTWNAGTPYVFLARHKSPERARWDAAHELGHLILHLETAPQGKVQENQADEFAREFLMPAEGVAARGLGLLVTLDVIRSEKLWWNVSAMAMIRQVKDVLPLTDWQYRSLVVEATKAGYRSREGDIDRETSLLIPKALATLAQNGVGLDQIATHLAVDRAELDGLLFSPVVGVASGEASSPPRRGHLRVVGDNSPH